MKVADAPKTVLRTITIMHGSPVMAYGSVGELRVRRTVRATFPEATDLSSEVREVVEAPRSLRAGS